MFIRESRFTGTWNGGMVEGWIVEWATMTNDPVPHQTYSSVHTMQLRVRKVTEKNSQGCKLPERQRL